MTNSTVNVKVIKNDQTIAEYCLKEFGSYDVGRTDGCHIKIEETDVSRKHLTLVYSKQRLIVRDNGSSNGSFFAERQLAAHQDYPIDHEKTVFLARNKVALKVTPPELNPPSVKSQNKAQNSDVWALLQRKKRIVIGRSSDCDYKLPSLQVSRKHAEIHLAGDHITLTDLNTTNGTFVNGTKISGTVTISATDQITIGAATFALMSGVVEHQYAIVADNIEKVYGKNVVGLNKMNLKIPSKQFVALMGPSGCGKSTLLKALNGANPATAGSIEIHGLKLNNSNFPTLKRHIGYVPQDDIVHGELTVQKTLFYAAKLRIADDVSNAEIQQKIEQILGNLNLDATTILKTRISELSGGQRKRISIAVELLNDPNILFLDEPTSPLDPETIEDFLTCIQQLVKTGKTVIMVTHKPSDLDFVDQVIFLSKGGYQTFFGRKERLLPHFGKDNIIEIYSMMKSAEQGHKWNERWVSENPIEPKTANKERLEDKRNNSGFRQFLWQSLRYFNIKISDSWNLALLLAQPLIIACLLIFIFSHLQVSVMFMMTISAVWFGVSNAAKEIVSELPVYERERMFNLSIVNYIASKLTVLSCIALIQVVLFVAIIYFAYQDPASPAHLWNVPASIAFMFLLSVSATLFGLFLSAVFDSTEKVMTFVPIALMPQIILAGIIAPLDSNLKVLLSYLTLGRWGTEGFAHIQDDSARKLGEWANQEADIPASVMQLMPVISVQQTPEGETTSVVTTELQPQGAIAQLDLYEAGDATLSLLPQSFSGVLIAITVINVVTVVGLTWALRHKDQSFV